MNFPAPNARSANAKSFARAFDDCMNRLKIHIPAPVADVMGMTNSMPELGSAAAHFTNFCHKYTPVEGPQEILV